jgi:hypothetical protein
VLVLAAALVACITVEGLIVLVLAHPRLLSPSGDPGGAVLAVARRYYVRDEEQIVQFLPPCAVYDPEVTYTLRPGTHCVVKNSEHTVEYDANRAGLRDDDASLDHPTVVVTGDSHAMGWGVPLRRASPACWSASSACAC